MASEIIVSINVKSGQADVSLKKAKVSVNKLAAAKEKLAEVEKDVAKKIALVNLQIKAQIQANNQSAAATLKNVNKTSGQFRTQVGLNNAILTEAGRAASDARFGFNGVANNVGQIASLFGNLIQTSDNVGQSLRNLGSSLMGTGGILIAIQLLIAYGDQIINFFRGISASAAKTEKAFEKLERTIASQREELEGYLEVLKDSTISEEIRANALNELNVIGEDVVDSYSKQKLSQEQLTLAVEDYMKQQRLRAELDAIISSNSALFVEKARIDKVQELLDEETTLEGRKKIYEENTNIFEKFMNAISGDILTETGGKGVLPRLLFGDEDADYAEVFRIVTSDVVSEADAIIKQLVGIEKQLIFNKKDPSGGSKRDPKVFEQKLLQLEQIEQRYREKSINNDLKTNEERINIFEENELAKLDIKIKNFIERRALTLKNYKEDIKNLKISNEEKQKLIEDAEKKHTEEKTKANNDRAKVKEQIEAVGVLKLKRLIDKEAQVRRASSLKEVETLKFSLGNNQAYYEAKAAMLKNNMKAEEDIVNSFAEGTTERANAESKLFKTKQLLIQNEVQQEIAAVEEKTRVQEAYVSYVSGVSGVLKSLAGENKAMQKAALVLEKGAAVAGIVIGASRSIAKSTASTSAANAAARIMYANPATIPVGAAIVAGNNIALAKEIAMTKTSAGIGIASILATSLTSAKSSSGGGGGGANVTAPNFNVVGASATNQLAGAVAGQINAPLRAYVVGSDISDQQELDRNIISTAGIG